MHKTTFVIIDDAVFMRKLMRKILEENSNYIVVDEGCDGLEAIEKAKLYHPDVMTLDITMPNLDGLQALDGIIKASPRTKVIIVSAMGQQPMVIDAIKQGATDFIVKPFDSARVLSAVHNVLNE